MMKKEIKTGNYLIQSNYFTKSVLRDASETQKEILYFLQSEIDFYDENATGIVMFNFLATFSFIVNSHSSAGLTFLECGGSRTI